METRHIIITGRSQSKERPRMAYGKAYTPKKTKEYEAKIYKAYKDKYADAPKMEGLLSVEVYVYFDKNNHGDIDNYEKIALDGLNGVAFHDDKAVRELHGYLVVDKSEPQRMEIFIRNLDENFVDAVAKKLIETEESE